MSQYVKFLFSMILACFMFGAYAQTTVADIKSGVISSLQKDGYLSDKMASEVATKYITQEDIQSQVSIINKESKQFVASNTEVKTTVTWTQYLSWINFIKVLGVILILVAFWGFIRKIISSVWYLVVAVPVIIYQIVFLSASLTGTIFPEKISDSEAFYVVLFCSFANLIIFGWIVAQYKQVQLFLAKICNIGLPEATVVSFWTMIYFAVLAVAYESTIFGFFAAIGLSGIFTFTLIYSPGVLFLYFKENALTAVVLGHVAVLAVYVGIYHSGVAEPYIQYFNAGIQYYCSIALGVGLLVGASPFYKMEQAIGYVILCILIGFAASMLYFFLDMTVIATVLFIFLALVFIEWVGFMGFQGGWIIGCATVGGLLYATSLFFEKYGSFIMTNIKSVIN